MKKVQTNESGIAHLMLIAVIAVVILVIGFVGWRVMSKDSQETSNSSYSTENLPENLDGVKSIDEIEDTLDLTADVQIKEYSLESSDDIATYIIKLSDGREIKVNAVTGEIISDSESTTKSESESETETESEVENEDETESSSDSRSSSSKKVSAKISTNEAYAIAAKLSASPIKKIEFEPEDDKATYKVEYRDGSKVEIDATNGNIIKSEIKSSEEDDQDDS